MHFGISEGKGGVKTWKQSVVGYGYFLELPVKQFPSQTPLDNKNSILRLVNAIFH